MRNLIFLSSSLLLMLTGCSSGSTGGDADAVVHNVFLTSPHKVGLRSDLTLPATIEESSSVSVGFKTAGQITRMLVKEGDQVRVGQLLAELDTVDYALGVNQLRLQYEMTQKENERYAILHSSRNMSDNDFEKATSGLQQLKMQLALQENKLSYCRLLSPVAGVVVKRKNEPSEMVDAGTPVFEIMDNGSLQVVVNLPARLYNSRGSFTAFSGESSLFPGKQFPLTLLSITPRADNHQLYRMKLAIERSQCPDLTSGMGITVKIASLTDNAEKEEYEVPVGSVFSRGQGTYVWSFNPSDSTISAKPVVIGSTGENGIVTVSGDLSTDEVIVRAGVHHLIEGEKVCPIEDNAASGTRNVI